MVSVPVSMASADGMRPPLLHHSTLMSAGTVGAKKALKPENMSLGEVVVRGQPVTAKFQLWPSSFPPLTCSFPSRSFRRPITTAQGISSLSTKGRRRANPSPYPDPHEHQDPPPSSRPSPSLPRVLNRTLSLLRCGCRCRFCSQWPSSRNCPPPSIFTSRQARTSASSRNSQKTRSSSVRPFLLLAPLLPRATRVESQTGADTRVLVLCRPTGHYKAEEWEEATKSYIINDQLGIQIVVQVRPYPDREGSRVLELTRRARAFPGGRERGQGRQHAWDAQGQVHLHVPRGRRPHHLPPVQLHRRVVLHPAGPDAPRHRRRRGQSRRGGRAGTRQGP